eukprot:1031047-Rhodomonas_salina.1
MKNRADIKLISRGETELREHFPAHRGTEQGGLPRVGFLRPNGTFESSPLTRWLYFCFSESNYR